VLVPQALPKCEHGYVDALQCRRCMIQSAEIHKRLRPLVNEFWKSRGQDLDHLLYRAYHMGMRHSADLEKGEQP
jgi:hypothetical protein